MVIVLIRYSLIFKHFFITIIIIINLPAAQTHSINTIKDNRKPCRGLLAGMRQVIGGEMVTMKSSVFFYQHRALMVVDGLKSPHNIYMEMNSVPSYHHDGTQAVE